MDIEFFGNLLKSSVRHSKANLPSWTKLAVKDSGLGLSCPARVLRRLCLNRVDVLLDVLFVVLGRESFVIGVYFDVLGGSGHVVYAFSKKVGFVLANGVHPESCQVRFECDSRELFSLRALRDLGPSTFAHVGGLGLFMFLMGVLICGFHSEFV